MKKKKVKRVVVDSELVESLGNTLADENRTPTNPQMLMGEAIEHLQGRQKEVYLLYMREDRSFAEVGEILGINRFTARDYLERAIKFITAYCEQGIKGGRV